MKFRIAGKDYEYNGKLTVEDAMFIYEKSQVGVTAFNRALFIEGNPHVIAAWMFLLKRRAGEAVRWEDVKQLDITDYTPVSDETPDGNDEGQAEGEADPTTPAGKTRRRATTSI